MPPANGPVLVAALLLVVLLAIAAYAFVVALRDGGKRQRGHPHPTASRNEPPAPRRIAYVAAAGGRPTAVPNPYAAPPPTPVDDATPTVTGGPVPG